MSNPRLLRLFLACWLSATLYCVPEEASAAPFCVQAQGIPSECQYQDAGQCRRRAAELKGLCVANKAELEIMGGIGKYCMVDSSRVVQCLYNDRASCDRDARAHNAACIDTPVESVQQDPYKLEPNRNY